MSRYDNPHNPESENEPDFFTWNEREITKKYAQTIGEIEAKTTTRYPTNRPKDSLDFDTNGIKKEAALRFEKVVLQNNGTIPDDFYFKAAELVDQYKDLNLKHAHQFRNAAGAIKYSQLRMLLTNADFVKNPRSVIVFEKLSDLQGRNLPVNFSMFETFKLDPDYASHYELSPGFGLEHLETFEQLIDSRKLWEMPEKRILFSSVASAIEQLSETNPAITLPLRLKLLENCMKHGQDPEIYHHLVYTFNSDEDQRVLVQLATKQPDSILGQMARKILDHGFDGTKWV